jgi:hypothetical protein
MALELDYILLKEDFTYKGWTCLKDNALVINKETIIVSHEDLCIIDTKDLQHFLLNDAQTTNEFDEAVKDVLCKNLGHFEFKGDGEGLGFILDIWTSEDAKINQEDTIHSATFWFDDYLN